MHRSMKIAIVGAGNAACITALAYRLYGQIRTDQIKEIEIYYDPNIPIERVGQGSLPTITSMVSQLLNVNYYQPENKLKAVLKSGILYENWGKETPKHFHPFLMANMAMHFSPHYLSKAVLESGLFKVIEKNIDDPESEIDANFIFDCRGRNNRDKELYNDLINPLNAVILSNKKVIDPDLIYTRTVATPHGWTFVIPTGEGVSYGYLYNRNITSKELAEKDFIERFDVVPDGYLNFDNYMAKNMFVGERTILNGNKLFFLDPLETTALDFYHEVAGWAWNVIAGDIFVDKWQHLDQCEGGKILSRTDYINNIVQEGMSKIQKFILWHYSKGSIYDTPFWNYAQFLGKDTFKDDEEFKKILEYSRKHSDAHLWDDNAMYQSWGAISIRNWDKVK